MPTNPPQPPTATEIAERLKNLVVFLTKIGQHGYAGDADDAATALLASAAREQEIEDKAQTEIVFWERKVHAAESRLTALREALTALPRYRLRHFRDDDETALSCEMGVERSDVDDGVLIRVEDLRAALSASVPPQSEPMGAAEWWGVIGPREMPCLYGKARIDAEEGRDYDERVALFRVEEVAHPEASPATERTPDHRDAYDAVTAPPSSAPSLSPLPEPLRTHIGWLLANARDDERYPEARGIWERYTDWQDGKAAPSSSTFAELTALHAAYRDALATKDAETIRVADEAVWQWARRAPSPAAPSSSREVESIREIAHELLCTVSIKRCGEYGCAHGVAATAMGPEWRCSTCRAYEYLRHLDAQEAELRGLIAQWRERAVQQRNLAGRSTARDAIALGGMADANEDRAADLDRLVTRRETKP